MILEWYWNDIGMIRNDSMILFLQRTAKTEKNGKDAVKWQRSCKCRLHSLPARKKTSGFNVILTCPSMATSCEVRDFLQRDHGRDHGRAWKSFEAELEHVRTVEKFYTTHSVLREVFAQWLIPLLVWHAERKGWINLSKRVQILVDKATAFFWIARETSSLLQSTLIEFGESCKDRTYQSIPVDVRPHTNVHC